MEIYSQPVNYNPEGLDFKRSFWIIFVLILIIQLFKFILSAYYGFTFGSFPEEYYSISQFGGILWYIILASVIIIDSRMQGISLGKIFNFNLTVFKNFFTKTFKYALGCAAFIIISSLLSIQDDFHLENQSHATIFLTFLTAVIIAPVIEEMAFRGYLYTAMFSGFKHKKERLVVNAMLFASAHVFLGLIFLGAGIPYYIFVLGYFLAKLYDESRSVVPGIVLHAFNNGFVFLIGIIKIYYLK